MAFMGRFFDALTGSPLRLYLLAFVVSAVSLAAAHAFENFGNMTPCILCLDQREVHWSGGFLALALMALGALRRNPRWLVYGLLLLALVYLYSTGLAFYHVGVEWQWWPGPAACAAGNIETINSGLSLDIGEVNIGPSCADVPWSLFGISMAGWNGLISLGLAVMMLAGFARFGLCKEAGQPKG